MRAVTRRCEATPLRLAQLLRAAAANGGELPPDLLGQLLDQVGQLNRNLLGPRGIGLNGLTNRENAVLRLVADGLSTRAIARELAYSERTIKAVIQELSTRLYFRNRAPRGRPRGPQRLDLSGEARDRSIKGFQVFYLERSAVTLARSGSAVDLG